MKTKKTALVKRTPELSGNPNALTELRTETEAPPPPGPESPAGIQTANRTPRENLYTFLMSPRRYGHWLALGVIIVLAVAGRMASFNIVYHEDPNRIISPDTLSYENPALALLKTGRFYSSADPGALPEFVRTPGYSIFLAAIYLLLGSDRYGVTIVQILLSGVTIGLVFFIVLRLRNRRAALIAALLMGLEPIAFLYSHFILTETLFNFSVALCALVGLELLRARHKEIHWAVALGVSIALAAHVRPVFYYLIFPMIVGMVLAKAFQYRTDPVRKKHLAKIAAGLFVPWLVLVGGWQLRNYVLAGTSAFSAIQDINLFEYRAVGVVALRDGITLEDAKAKLIKELGDKEKLPPLKKFKVYREESFKIFRQYPKLTFAMILSGLDCLLRSQADNHLNVIYLFPNDASWYDDFKVMSWEEFRYYWLGQGLHLFLVAILLKTPLSYLLYIGMIFAPFCRGLTRERLFVGLFLAGMLLYLILISAGPEANYRLRLPLTPICGVLAGLGWDKLWSGLKRMRSA